MKLFSLCWWFLVISILPGYGKDATTKGFSIDYNIGLSLSYNQVGVVSDDPSFANTMSFSYAALQVDLDLFDNLLLGVMVGFSGHNFKDPVDFTGLPLTLRYDNQSFGSMVLGLRGKSEFALNRNFSVQASAGIMLVRTNEVEDPITLPVETGVALINHSFTQVSAQILAQYDGITDCTIFLGPSLNLLKGSTEANEEIGAITAREPIDYHQKKMVGVVGGFQLNLGTHFLLEVSGSLISKTSLTATFSYVL